MTTEYLYHYNSMTMKMNNITKTAKLGIFSCNDVQTTIKRI